jgi:hypothetical protein
VANRSGIIPNELLRTILASSPASVAASEITRLISCADPNETGRASAPQLVERVRRALHRRRKGAARV